MEGKVDKRALRRLMAARGFNQSSLSFAVSGTSRTLVRDILRRKNAGANIKTIKKMSEVLDCDPNDLICGDGGRQATKSNIAASAPLPTKPVCEIIEDLRELDRRSIRPIREYIATGKAPEELAELDADAAALRQALRARVHKRG